MNEPIPEPQVVGWSLNAPWQGLDALDRSLWRAAVCCSAPSAAPRLRDLPQWQAALEAGELPSPACDLGDAGAIAPLRAAIGRLALTELTRGEAGVARQLLNTLMWHLDRLVDRPAGQTREAAIADMAASFEAQWQVQRQSLEAVRALLQTVGDLAHLAVDALRGRLVRREWAQALRIAQHLQSQPALVRYIDAVGRARRADDAPPAADPQPAPGPAQRLRLAEQIHLADQPSAVRGVKRSGQIARMLAAEAAQMRHPVLRRLWRARLAESRLLTYEDEAVLTEWREVDDPRPLPAAATPRPRGQGPLIVCLDTSGSMRGAPGEVARACLLQALRTAAAGARDCRVLAFGASGELLERRLGADAQGLDHLLDLMGQAFDGGTDVQTPLERAVEIVGERGWALADILIVSDGEFGVTPPCLARLRAARAELALRVHGVLIGDRETIGLAQTCDSLHWVRDWRRHADDARGADAQGYSPVHSASLTALYFPNAIQR